ncbi:MAG: hypothetical protein ACRD1E_08475, partial [Terriglobales bacterium]
MASCPQCRRDAAACQCAPSLLPPVPEWRRELQQRVGVYRARRLQNALPAAAPARQPVPRRILSFPPPPAAAEVAAAHEHRAEQLHATESAQLAPRAQDWPESVRTEEASAPRLYVPTGLQNPSARPAVSPYLQLPLPMAPNAQAQTQPLPCAVAAPRERVLAAGLDAMLVGMAS